jgi:hypothetical protein
MGTDHRAINDEVFHVRFIGEVLMHSFPNTLFTPAGEPLVDAVPLTVLGRQQSPLGTASANPYDGFNEAAAFCFLSYVHV